MFFIGDVAHFEEPEDCLQDILKFQKKHSDMLYKCHKEVQYCLAHILGVAKQFIGPYRLQRLTCECLTSFLASCGTRGRIILVSFLIFMEYVHSLDLLGLITLIKWITKVNLVSDLCCCELEIGSLLDMSKEELINKFIPT